VNAPERPAGGASDPLEGSTGAGSFYAELDVVETFEELGDPDSYRRLPADWWIVTADVAGSTLAIARGRYREVNSVGVAVIAAVRNAAHPTEIPYVFGGDGAMLCVPGFSLAAVSEALAATVAMAEASFGLELRGGVVPVSYVRERGLDVLVARHRVSRHFVQCALHGGGVELVERSLKEGTLPDDYVVRADAEAEAAFDGLECRWEEVPSPADETLSLIIETQGPQGLALQGYRWVMERIRAVYGDADQCRPLEEGGLKVTLSPAKLSREAGVKAWRSGRLERWWIRIGILIQAAVGRYLFRRGVRTSRTDWSVYKRDLVANTDFRKFDGTLRLVLTGTPDQRRELELFLERLVDAGVLRFGMHVSDAVVVTCLVEGRQGDHLHFVDGSGGGYAVAAGDLKARRDDAAGGGGPGVVGGGASRPARGG